MREFNFDVNFLEPGDIITKSGGGVATRLYQLRLMYILRIS